MVNAGLDSRGLEGDKPGEPRVTQWPLVLDVALLGTGGMMPLPHRWLSSVLLRWGGHLILFDCGEGTQITLRALGWGIKDVDLVLLSHLHGDHLGGLPGLLLTQGNAGRQEPVRIIGPPGLRGAVDGLRVLFPYLPFALDISELADGDGFEFDALRGSTVPAEHSVPCLAYRLDIPRKPRFLPERVLQLKVPREQWKRLQEGEAVEWQGRRIEPREVQGPPRSGLAVGLVTDTRPSYAIASLVKGVDLLVCEGTYGSSADQLKAIQRKHMTFAEAAGLARQADVGQLLLTHFSPALADPESHAGEAQAIFPATTIGRDHLTLSLNFPEQP